MSVELDDTDRLRAYLLEGITKHGFKNESIGLLIESANEYIKKKQLNIRLLSIHYDEDHAVHVVVEPINPTVPTLKHIKTVVTREPADFREWLV